jgi:hypothetical protein
VDVAPASPQPDTGVEPETDTVATPDTAARPMEFGQTAQDDPFARQTPAVALPEHPQALPGQESLPRIAAGPTESVSADSPPVGARFSTSTAATPPLPQAQPTPFYPGTPQPGWPTPTAEQMGSTPTHALPPQAPTVTSVPFGQPPKKRNTKLIAIIGGGGVLLLAVIVLVFWLGGPGGGSPGALSLTYNQFGYLAEESSLAETDYGPFSVNSDLQRIEALLQSMEVEDEFRGHPQLFAESKQSSMPMSLVLFDNAVNAEKLQTAYAAHFLTQSGTQVTLDETVDSVRLWSATDDNSGTSGRSLAYGNVLAFAMDSEDGTQAWKDFGLKEFKVAVDEAAASPALGGTVAPNPGIATPTTQPPSGNTAPASSGKLTFTGEADFPQCDDFYATFVLSADRKSVSEVELVAYGPKGDDLNIDKLTQSSSGSFDVDDDGHVLVTLGNGTKLDVTINGDTATGSVSFVFTTQGVGNTNGVALDFGEQPITLTGK